MHRPLILRPEAESDIAEIRLFLEERQSGLGDRFALRLREMLRRIEFLPESFGIVWKRVRAVRLKRFPLVSPRLVRAHAVLHRLHRAGHLHREPLQSLERHHPGALLRGLHPRRVQLLCESVVLDVKGRPFGP